MSVDLPVVAALLADGACGPCRGGAQMHDGVPTGQGGPDRRHHGGGGGKAVHGRAAPQDGPRTGTRTGNTAATPDCRPRSRGSCPQGFKAGPLQWPVRGKDRLARGDIINYGYDDEVVLLTEITPPRATPGGGNHAQGQGGMAGVRRHLRARQRGSECVALAVGDKTAPPDQPTRDSLRKLPCSRYRSPTTPEGCWVCRSRTEGGGNKLRISRCP